MWRTWPSRARDVLEYLANGGSTVSLNVGTGLGSSVKQVIEAAESVTGRQVPVEAGAPACPANRRPCMPMAPTP